MKSRPGVASTLPGWLPLGFGNPTLEWRSRLRTRDAVPLLGKAEKAQLEEMILKRFQEHFDAHGPSLVDTDGLVLDYPGLFRRVPT